jgi:ubiquinone/menaquinone biosynthesis C-methylase UbiE
MRGYRPVMTFDEANAAVYDDLVHRGDEEQTVAVLAELAGPDGPVLELAIGTGRLALPLAATGVRVDGLDLSEPMVARLRAKPGGADLDVVLADMASFDLPGRRYRLIYVAFNSFFNVLAQDDQVRTFERVAAHLDEGGAFVLEGGATLPFFQQLTHGQYVETEDLEVDAVRFDLLRLDPATQLLEENHVRLTKEGATFNPVMQRYAWPAELDLMGRLAGLRLEHRWGGWHRQPFTAASTNVVSVYRA